MKDFELLKGNYLKLRTAFINYLEKFDSESYYYQPTKKSNSTAWIVPHIAAFEKIMVINKILGFNFKEFISEEDVEKYKPAIDGFNFSKDQMMTKEEAISLLRKTEEVSINFLDCVINQSESIVNIDPEIAFDRYMLNFSH